jgi:ParB-like chromosome segregation protein Spo0J
MSDRPLPAHDLTVHLVAPDSVRPHPRNPNKGNVDAIADSMEENGVFAPIGVQRSTGYVIDGNHRYLAMRDRGEEAIPVVYLDVTDEQATRILLASNRTRDLATYDDGLLSSLLIDLPDLDGTGYTEDDLAALLPKLPTLDLDLEDGRPARPAAHDDRDDDDELGDDDEGEEWSDYKAPNFVVSYSLVFDDEDQQKVWYRYVRWLKDTQPGDSIGERLVNHLGTFLPAAED